MIEFKNLSSPGKELQVVIFGSFEDVKVEGHLFNVEENPGIFYFVLIIGDKKGKSGTEKGSCFWQYKSSEDELYSKAEEIIKKLVLEWKETHFEHNDTMEW